MLLLWMTSAILNLLYIGYISLTFYKDFGYLNYKGVAFLSFWSVVLAPFILGGALIIRTLIAVDEYYYKETV